MNPTPLNPPLAEKAMQSLPPGSIRPTGWLLNQLRIQADGLSGHLDEFWPDIARSGWIGGDAEGWERGPCWLDGLVPLAFLLQDETLIAKVRRWMDYILDHQHEDGWLGPRDGGDPGSEERAMDPWPQFVLFKAMSQFQEATGDERIIPAMQRALRRIDALLEEKPLESWAKMRWPELVLSIQWLYDRTGEKWLLGLIEKAGAQGYNWYEHFWEFLHESRQRKWSLEAHVVNNAMALKEPAVQYRHTLNRTEGHDSATGYIEVLDVHHGQATGVFTGDEVLAGASPSQGTELCAVVEYMFSLETLSENLGDPEFGDRLEMIAFNALPATFKPDMWAHQYDQQANQVVCEIGKEVVYTTNAPDSNIFGLEPNYGCCTANMHQGWPKLATHLWMHSSDDGIAAVAYAPCTVQLEVQGVAVQIEVKTDYPFAETIEVVISVDEPVTFPIHLRIPSWADRPKVSVGDKRPKGVVAGLYANVERNWSGQTSLKLRFPMPVLVEERYHGGIAIQRGPLVYCLKIGEEWRQVRGEAPHADWEVHPTTPWNYALEIDLDNPEEWVSFESGPVGECPFSPEGAPIKASVKGRRLPGWKLDRGAAARLPESPVSSSEPLEDLTLIPYGCTNLRVTEFPWLE